MSLSWKKWIRAIYLSLGAGGILLGMLVLTGDWGMIRRAKEAVLQENLFTLRTCLDQYNKEKGMYPEELQDLVESGYLREIPIDPVTGSATTWVVICDSSAPEKRQQIIDVKSGAKGKGPQGIPYSYW